MTSIPACFWLAQFEVSTEDAGRTSYVAIEILKLEDDRFAIAISTTDERTSLDLDCYVAFANQVADCDLARRWGFPVVEAEIKGMETVAPSRQPATQIRKASISYDPAEQVVRVIAPFIPDSDSGGAGMGARYGEQLLEVRGVTFADCQEKGAEAEVTYRQSVMAADAWQPDAEVEVPLDPLRSPRQAREQQRKTITLTLAPSREPDLMPLPRGKHHYTARVLSGSIPSAEAFLSEGQAASPRYSQRRDRGDGLRRVFRFEDVEVLGFRVDLRHFGDEADRVLNALVAPLNFHRDVATQAADPQCPVGFPGFYYAAASRTLVIELLRYGKMMETRKRVTRDRVRGRRRRDASGSRLRPDDYASQHELLVRVLVGRLDEDVAQARDPAVFVPAIFVDNPFSKDIGLVQGFDKRLAYFCTSGIGEHHRALFPDGRLPDAKLNARQPLSSVSQVRYVNAVGETTTGDLVFSLDVPQTASDDSAFVEIDPKLSSGRSWLSGVRWRQTDFDAVEFRRSFARPVVADGISGMRSVQVSPLDDSSLKKTWVEGTFDVDRVALAFPAGIATVELHAPDTAPEPWRLLQGLVGKRLSLPTGDWYRMRLSMRFALDDGLRW